MQVGWEEYVERRAAVLASGENNLIIFRIRISKLKLEIQCNEIIIALNYDTPCIYNTGKTFFPSPQFDCYIKNRIGRIGKPM